MPPETNQVLDRADSGTVTPQEESSSPITGSLASRQDMEKAIAALMGESLAEAPVAEAKVEPKAKTAAEVPVEAKVDAKASAAEEGAEDTEPTHGQKSFQGKLEAEAARLKTEREAIVAERAALEQLKAGKTEPEAATPESAIADIKLPRLNPADWDSPEFVDNFNGMTEQVERSHKALFGKIASLEARLAEAEMGAKVAQGLAQREVHTFMTTEGERASKLFEAKYDMKLTADQAWGAVSDYMKLHPDFIPTEQSSYTDDKWVEILERAHGLDILRHREAKDNEAKSTKTPRPPVTASGTSSVNAKPPQGSAALLTKEDTRRALEQLLKTS